MDCSRGKEFDGNKIFSSLKSRVAWFYAKKIILSILQGNKASFLTRDASTLNKLASLVKTNPEAEGTNTVAASKGRNFVFATVSPAVDKMVGLIYFYIF